MPVPGIAIGTGAMIADGRANAVIATAIAIAEEMTRDALLLNRGVTGLQGERWPRVRRDTRAVRSRRECTSCMPSCAYIGRTLGSECR